MHLNTRASGGRKPSPTGSRPPGSSAVCCAPIGSGDNAILETTVQILCTAFRTFETTMVSNVCAFDTILASKMSTRRRARKRERLARTGREPPRKNFEIRRMSTCTSLALGPVESFKCETQPTAICWKNARTFSSTVQTSALETPRHSRPLCVVEKKEFDGK